MEFIKRQKKSSDKNKREFSRSELERNYDKITFYIGMFILALATINSFKPIPYPFIIGASISGLCFSISDYIMLSPLYRRGHYLVHQFSIRLGVVFFFLLPVILITFFKSYERLGSISDTVTFLALGLVIGGIGLKSLISKMSFMKDLNEEVNSFREEKSQLVEEIRQLKEQQVTLSKQIIDSNSIINVLHDKIHELENNK